MSFPAAGGCRDQPLGPRAPLVIAGAAVVVGFAWWAMSFRPFTWPATVATITGGLAAIAVGVRRRPPAAMTRRALGTGTAVWVALLAALGAWELAAFLQNPRVDHPTLSSLANPLLDHHAVRVVGFLVWLAVTADLAKRS